MTNNPKEALAVVTIFHSYLDGIGTDKYPQLIDEETFRAVNEKKPCKAKSLC